jgi:hypothetical protein
LALCLISEFSEPAACLLVGIYMRERENNNPVARIYISELARADSRAEPSTMKSKSTPASSEAIAFETYLPVANPPAVEHGGSADSSHDSMLPVLERFITQRNEWCLGAEFRRKLWNIALR